MRWHDQIVEKDREVRLPGFADAVERTFDAPEALGARFQRGAPAEAIPPPLPRVAQEALF